MDIVPGSMAFEKMLVPTNMRGAQVLKHIA